MWIYTERQTCGQKEKKHQTIITVGKQRRLKMINTGECMRSGSVSSSCMLPAMLLSQINVVSELQLLISEPSNVHDEDILKTLPNI